MIDFALLQADTLRLIDSNQVIEFYRDLMDKQSSQFGILITVVIAIFTLLLGVSWWWNVSGIKHQVKGEIEIAKSSIEEQQEKWQVESTTKLEEYVSGHIKELGDSLRKDLRLQEADLDRLYGRICTDKEMYIISAEWLFSAFNLYRKNDRGSEMEVTLESGLVALREALKKENLSEADRESIKCISTIVDEIPEVYHSRKKEAQVLIVKLNKKLDSGLESKE